MNIDELRSTVAELRDEIESLSTAVDITPEQDARLTEALDEFEARTTELAAAEARAERIARARATEVRRDAGFDAPQIMRKVDRVIRRSLEYAMAHDPELPAFVRSNAQEMNPDVMRKHISLYVNDFSLSLGSSGRAAVWKMLEVSSMFTPAPANNAVEIFL